MATDVSQELHRLQPPHGDFVGLGRGQGWHGVAAATGPNMAQKGTLAAWCWRVSAGHPKKTPRVARSSPVGAMSPPSPRATPGCDMRQVGTPPPSSKGCGRLGLAWLQLLQDGSF